ncbi:MAG: NAD(P)H-hydrate dehydratase [Gammaproteobacteria bacterium]|nr:NAD(P)H-hydrate dehydratase [Gammaproteobacteria bacterium]NNJ98185.1 NAD(P)H-hydrate dehydratase [Gammaproteobacteria bacterium]
MKTLPSKLYSAAAVARLDQTAINDYGIPGYTLMRRAGQAVYNALEQQYPDAQSILVVCGAGNNAGDGYVFARLAHDHGCTVRVVSLVAPDNLAGDARQAWQHWQECGETELYHDGATKVQADVIIDALLGTGLTREVEGDWKRLIIAVNRSGIPVISIDIPSGLNANTGVVFGAAIKAELTISFIGLKKGLFTGNARTYSGEVIFDSLGVPAAVYESVTADAELLSDPAQWLLPRRQRDSHKGQNGHVVIIGGNYGMPGSVALAARAALRAGAGLVSVVTRKEHINAVVAVCPESMVHGSANGELAPGLLENADYLAIGCGLGKDAWAQRLLYTALNSVLPMVVDADALNLLANIERAMLTEESIITPHPGEASRLLQMPTGKIQQDRFLTAQLLEQKYNAQVVLKGSGTIIQQGNATFVTAGGNPAMATAGMGDVLTGMISALAAQQAAMVSDVRKAVINAVSVHALAGDIAARGDDRGLMATDVIEHIREAAAG